MSISRSRSYFWRIVPSVVERTESESQVDLVRWPEASGLYGVRLMPYWRTTGMSSRSSSR